MLRWDHSGKVFFQRAGRGNGYEVGQSTSPTRTHMQSLASSTPITEDPRGV